MQKKATSESGLFNPRSLLAFALCSVATLLAMFSFAATPLSGMTGLRASSPGDSLFAGQRTGSLSSNATAAAAASGWSIVTSPNATVVSGDSKLRNVTCVSVSDCWAVGSNGFGTLIERWDGNSWAIISSPNTSVSQPNQLNGVTCASASDCWAVGSYKNGSNFSQTLIERWDGNSWTIVGSPNTSSTQYNLLNGVTCASASQCWAVGGYYNNGYHGLIERWDGNSWTIVTSPSTNGQLNGVTCASSSDCWAVGGNNIEHWDGSAWTIVTSPSTGGQLGGVSCASASDCWAVGSYINGAYQTLIEHWDGTSWTVVSSPNTSSTESNQLHGVTCASASDCSAVGTYSNNSGYEYTLIEKWDGSSWTIVTSLNISVSQDNQLQGVTCASASNCWAVGDYLSYNGANYYWQTLIEKWDGNSWTIVTSPNTSLPQPNQLNGVTCTSASDCWAVGYHIFGSIYRTLIEHWDGTAWTVVTSPNTSSNLSNILYGVTCTSASQCWAVGVRCSGDNWQTLIEKWDGSSWTIVTSPNTSSSWDNYLNGVTCTSASSCWAAGDYTDGNNYRTLIEKWDGNSWTIVTSPNSSAAVDNQLNGVTCASASECWAVGSIFSTTSVLQTLIEQWDGSSWTIVTSPNTSATQHNVLNGVTCASASECWAVGYSMTSGFQTLIEQWDGTSWTINNPLLSTPTSGKLSGVSCASTSNCWAVGSNNTGSNDQTLTEQWDGSSWSAVSSTNTSSTQNNVLNGVTCASASGCWAAGYFFNGTVNQTLIEKFTPTIPPFPNAVSRMTHGSAGTFDVNLPMSGTPGVEDRTSASLGAGNYTIVFSFANNLVTVVSASASACGGSVSSSGIGPNPNQYTVNLTAVSNACQITVTLTDVLDSAGNLSNAISGTMGVLVGDANASGRVDSGDVSLVRQQTLQTVTSSNFRDDINASGRVDSGDVSIARQQTLTSLP